MVFFWLDISVIRQFELENKMKRFLECCLIFQKKKTFLVRVISKKKTSFSLCYFSINLFWKSIILTIHEFL